MNSIDSAGFVTRARAVCSLFIFAVTGASQLASAQITHVVLEAEDGLELRATMYASDERGPGVLLHHMCGDWRADYHALARSLMEGGFSVLTYDLRGEGETLGPRPFRNGRATAEALDAFFASDASIALAYLRNRPNVDPEKIVVGGASCGTFPTVRLALEHEGVLGIMLLSGIPPTLDQLLGDRPTVRLFGVTARDDRAAQLPRYEELRSMEREGDEIRVFETGGHGTRNLSRHPELIGDITTWIRRVTETGPNHQN